MSARPAQTIRVWDLPTRFFHWSLAVAVIALLITGKVGGDAMVWHSRVGYGVASLLLARIAWGFIGGHWSRFRAFSYSPRNIIGALRSEVDPNFEVGHSPAGALSVYAMLAFLVGQAGTGMFSDDRADFSGPLSAFVSNDTVRLLTSYHKNVGEWILIVLVLLHVGAIAYYQLRKGKNLVRPMWSGDRTLDFGAPSSRDDLWSRLLALLTLAVSSAIIALIVKLGG